MYLSHKKGTRKMKKLLFTAEYFYYYFFFNAHREKVDFAVQKIV